MPSTTDLAGATCLQRRCSAAPPAAELLSYIRPSLSIELTSVWWSPLTVDRRLLPIDRSWPRGAVIEDRSYPKGIRKRILGAAKRRSSRVPVPSAVDGLPRAPARIGSLLRLISFHVLLLLLVFVFVVFSALLASRLAYIELFCRAFVEPSRTLSALDVVHRVRRFDVDVLWRQLLVVIVAFASVVLLVNLFSRLRR
jgi:hypothetical protein